MSDKEKKGAESDEALLDTGDGILAEADQQPNLTRSYFVVIVAIFTILAFFMTLTFSKVAPKGAGDDSVWGNLVKVIELIFSIF